MKLGELFADLSLHPGREVTTLEGDGFVRRSFSRLQQDVGAASERLRGLGIVAGDRVGILAETRYEWLVFDLALAALDAICVALAEEDEGGCEAAFAELGLRLLLSSSAQAKRRKLPAETLLIDADDGSSLPTRAADPFAAPTLQTGDFSLVFSSGTAGGRKGMIVTKEGSEALIEAFAEAFEMKAGDRVLVFMPLSSYQQRLFCYAAVHFGMDLVMVPATAVFHALRQCSPSVIIGPPALFEAVELQARARSAVAEAQGQGEFDRLLREALGGNPRVLVMGMAKPNPNTLATYAQASLPLYEVYGLTECGVATVNCPRWRRPGSVGKPLRGAAVHLLDDGEIVVSKQRPLTRGYFVAPAGVDADVFGPEGLRTGDFGKLDEDGFLYITGRKSALIITRAGHKLQPEVLEEVVLRCPVVKRAVLLQGEQVGLEVVVDTGAVRSLELESAVRGTLERMNAELPDWCRIKRFVLSDDAFTPANGLLTQTLKVNRAAVARRFEGRPAQDWVQLAR